MSKSRRMMTRMRRTEKGGVCTPHRRRRRMVPTHALTKHLPSLVAACRHSRGIRHHHDASRALVRPYGAAQAPHHPVHSP